VRCETSAPKPWTDHDQARDATDRRQHASRNQIRATQVLIFMDILTFSLTRSQPMNKSKSPRKQNRH
jgi:hypothetical protein